MDEEGGLEREFVDADIGVPFAVGAGGAVFEGRGDGDGDVRVGLAFVEGEAARGEFVVGVVEPFDGGAGVGGELRGRHAPVADFGDCVAKGAGGADIGGGVEGGAVIGVEGAQRRVDILDGAGVDGEGAVSGGLRANVGVWVEGLPDGEESIDVGVVQEEDRVEGAVAHSAHPAADQAVDGVVDGFQ